MEMLDRLIEDLSKKPNRSEINLDRGEAAVILCLAAVFLFLVQKGRTMKKLWTVLLLAGVIVMPVWADDKPEEKSVREQFQEIIKDFQEAQQPLAKEFRAAKTDEEREAIIAKLPKMAKPYGDRAVKLAKAHSKDPLAPQMLAFALQVAQNDSAGETLLEIQREPRALSFTVAAMASQSDNPAAEKFLRLAMEKSKDKQVQGAACLGLAQMQFNKSDSAKDEKSAASFSKSAEEYATKAAHEYADTVGPQGKLGEQAERLLFQIRNLAVGKSAPEVVSRDLDEKETKLSGLRGKVVVLDIWATWCGPCKAMIPHEREMVEKLKGKPFALVSISADDKKETLKEFLEKAKMPWTHWWEGRREKGILKDWNVTFFPTIYVIDAKGVIRYKNIRGAKLEEAVEKLLKEAGKKS